MPAGSVPTVAWACASGRAYAADGGVYSAAAAVDWLVRIGVLRYHAELATLDGNSSAGAGVFFVPALAGLGFPHWDRSATGLLMGLDAGTTREAVIKAVLEGIAFRIAEVLDGLGFAPEAAVPIDGGLSRATYFTRFLADITGRALLLQDNMEVTSLGVAQLAAAVAQNDDPASAPAGVAGGIAVKRRMDNEVAAKLRGRFAEVVERSRGWRP
jgi:glycerol kinase